MSLFRVAIKMDPTRADYLMNLGITYMMDNDYKSARVAFQVTLPNHPRDPCTRATHAHTDVHGRGLADARARTQ